MHGILSQGRVYSRRKESGLSGLPVCHLRAFRETLEGVGTLRRRISRKLSAADGKDGESGKEHPLMGNEGMPCQEYVPYSHKEEIHRRIRHERYSRRGFDPLPKVL